MKYLVVLWKIKKLWAPVRIMRKEKRLLCLKDGSYGNVQDNCVLRPIKQLLDQSEVTDL